MDPAQVTVHVMMAGGAFGRKFKCDYVQEAAALSRAVGAPVHLTWSREEDTRTGYYHSVSAQHIEAALDAEGNVTGLAAPGGVSCHRQHLQSTVAPQRG